MFHINNVVHTIFTYLVEHGYNPIKCRWYKDTMLLDPSEKQMMQSFGSRLDSIFKTWVWIKIMLVWAMSLLLFFQINISRGCFVIILHQRLTSCSHTNAGTVSSWRTWASQTLETILVSLKTHSEGDNDYNIRCKRWKYFLDIQAFVGDKVGCRENLWCFLEVSLFSLRGIPFHESCGFLRGFLFSQLVS